MLTAEISRVALELPIEDRLELARCLIENVVEATSRTNAVKKGHLRIEDVAVGRVTDLSEEQYRDALS